MHHPLLSCRLAHSPSLAHCSWQKGDKVLTAVGLRLTSKPTAAEVYFPILSLEIKPSGGISESISP